MQKNNTTAITISVIVVILVVIAIVLVTRHPAPSTDMANPSSDTGSQSTTSGSGSPSSTTTQANGSKVLNVTPSNTEVDYNSDLEAFSIVPGSHILSLIQGTGTIDPTYVQNGEIRIELADQNYTTTKVITGSVTGSDPKGNIKFQATFDTTGIKKGAGFIIFKQVSGNHTVHIPIVFD